MKKIRKTKIIATIGPATSSYSSICKLIKSGVDVFRLNFSHGDYVFFRKVISNIKKARERLKRPVAIMQDLQGPKVRIGKLSHEFSVKRGDEIAIKDTKIKLQEKEIYIDIKNLYKYVGKGQRILINDGVVELKIKEVRGRKIICNVITGGEIKSRKGVNLPGIKIPVPALTLKDRKDLKFGLKNGVDAVCLSFVRDKDDLTLLNKHIKREKPVIIAKIEKPEALKQIDGILELCDGIMVARGDLAVEAGYSIIPSAQKMLISKANKKGKIVIVATQMLESMINSPFPQRAEITDIYNAVIDGADILMLSAETSVGKFPFKTVNVMDKIILTAEREKKNSCHFIKPVEIDNKLKSIISYCAVLSSCKLHDSIIAVKTKSIDDVAFVSDYRPDNCVAAVTDDRRLFNKLALVNSIHPFFCRGDNIPAEVKKFFPGKNNIVYADFYDKKSPRLVLYELKK